MPKSIKQNYILNLINTVLTVLFPLVTFPYASRILMADGIGQVNFFNSIISYITLLSALGIPLYAIRETARVRDDAKQLSITTTEILLLHIALSMLGYIAVGVISLTVSKVSENIPLFLLLSTSILLSTIGVNWFYQGVEDFKYITIRNIFVKIVTVILLFVLVHEKDDLLLYALVGVVGNLGNNVFNFYRLRKYVKPKHFTFNELHPFRHFKPACRIFVLNLIISVYVQLNTIMLGFMNGTTAVGYYYAANKVTTILVPLASALGTVLLPRLSNLIKNNQMEEFKRLSQKAIDFMFIVSTPLSMGLIVLAPTVIHAFCGQTYEPAILCLQILAPIVFLISISQVIGIQILYPQGKENIVTVSTCIGAFINIVVNIVLIPRYSQYGAAISTVLAELGVTITQIIIGTKYVPVKFLNKQNFLVILSSVVMFIMCYALQEFITSGVYRFIAIPIVGAIAYSSLLFLFRNPLVIEIKSVINQKIIKRR